MSADRSVVDGKVEAFLPTMHRPHEFAQPALLLLLAEQPSYGYELRDRLSEFGEYPDPGRIYRVLQAMEAARLVRSTVRASDAGPDRRVYRITAEGRRSLDASAGHLLAVRTHLSQFLVRHAVLVGAAAGNRPQPKARLGAVSRALRRLTPS